MPTSLFTKGSFMSQKVFDAPEQYAVEIDSLVKNVVVSVARDIEANHFAGMNEEQVVQNIYSKYVGLFVPHGCIETAKRKYAQIYADREALADEDEKFLRRSAIEHRQVWVFRTLTAVTIAIVAILAALGAKS